MRYEYGAMSSRYSLEAENHLVAISAMLLHYGRSNHLVVVYQPKDVPAWFSFDGRISARLEEIFGGDVEDFIKNNDGAVKAAYRSIQEV